MQVSEGCLHRGGAMELAGARRSPPSGPQAGEDFGSCRRQMVVGGEDTASQLDQLAVVPDRSASAPPARPAATNQPAPASSGLKQQPPPAGPSRGAESQAVSRRFTQPPISAETGVRPAPLNAARQASLPAWSGRHCAERWPGCNQGPAHPPHRRPRCWCAREPAAPGER